MRFVAWIVVNVVALGVATWLFAGITLDAPTAGEQVLALGVVGAVFGVINAFVKPVVQLLSLPFIVLTLGLFLLVINAVVLLVTSAVAGGLGVDFHVAGFGTALLGSIVISIVSWVLSGLLDVEPVRR